MFNKPLDQRISCFWKWFVAESPRIQTPIAARALTGRLRKVHPRLAWAVEPGRDGAPYTLEISPDGQREHAELVRQIVAAAPDVDGWRIVAFRQVAEGFSIELGGSSVKADECLVALYRGTDGSRGIRLFMPDRIARGSMKRLAPLILDNSLGEEVVLGYELMLPEPLSQAPTAALPLSKMREHLKKYVP